MARSWCYLYINPLPFSIHGHLTLLHLVTQIVPEGDFERVGFTQGMVKLRASEGGGFIAQMEVFHNLHCLDTLRQGLYFNYDYYHANRHGVWERSDAVVRKHMGMSSLITSQILRPEAFYESLANVS